MSLSNYLKILPELIILYPRKIVHKMLAEVNKKGGNVFKSSLDIIYYLPIYFRN